MKKLKLPSIKLPSIKLPSLSLSFPVISNMIGITALVLLLLKLNKLRTSGAIPEILHSNWTILIIVITLIILYLLWTKILRKGKFEWSTVIIIIICLGVLCIGLYMAPSIKNWFNSDAAKNEAIAKNEIIKSYAPVPTIPTYRLIPDNLKVDSLSLSTTHLEPGVAYVYFRDEKIFDIQLTKEVSGVELAFTPVIVSDPSWVYHPEVGKPGMRDHLIGSDLNFKNCVYYITTNKSASVAVTGSLKTVDPDRKSLRSL